MSRSKISTLFLAVFILFLSYFFVDLAKRIYIKDRSRKLNLILISVDTLRGDHLGIYGYKKNTSPNIDRFFKDSVTFSNAHTIVPTTYESFFTLFTGSNAIYGDNYFSNWNQFKTFPEALGENKYKTAAFVTNPALAMISPIFKKGFDEFYFFNRGGTEDVYDSTTYANEYQNSEELTKKSIEWLGKNHDKKFFLWLHYTTPHTPYNPPKKYICDIDKDCGDLSKYQVLLSEETTQLPPILKSCTDVKAKEEDIRLAMNLYDAEILSVDDQIGKVLHEVGKLGLDGKTVVIFYGDHGEGFDHNIFGHQIALYESALRIPFMIKSPLVKGKPVAELFDNIDMFPTVLNAVGIDYQSSNLSRLSKKYDLLDNGFFYGRVKPYVYFKTVSYKINRFGIYDGKYKYIYTKDNFCLNNNNHEELYNLVTDKGEFRNLVEVEKVKSAAMKKSLFQDLGYFNKGVVKNYTKSNESIERLRTLGY